MSISATRTNAHLLVLNANSDELTSAVLARRARQVARPGTVINVAGPLGGPRAVTNWRDAYRSAVGLLDRVESWTDRLDGVVLCGYGDLGYEGLREVLDVPVVDITEASTMAALSVGPRYAVVTTTESMIPLIESRLEAFGQSQRCVLIAEIGIGPAALGDDPQRLGRRFAEAAAAARAAGASSICLGSAPLTGFAEQLATLAALPVVDGVAVGVSWCEVLHHLRLSAKPGQSVVSGSG